MRVGTAQWISFTAHNTQEEDVIFVSFVQIFLLLGLEGRAYKDDIDVSIVFAVLQMRESEIMPNTEILLVRARKKQNSLGDRLE